jgi:hypothetical protein
LVPSVTVDDYQEQFVPLSVSRYDWIEMAHLILHFTHEMEGNSPWNLIGASGVKAYKENQEDPLEGLIPGMI